MRVPATGSWAGVPVQDRTAQRSHQSTSTGTISTKSRLLLAAADTSPLVRSLTARRPPQPGQSSPVSSLKGHSPQLPEVCGSRKCRATVSAPTPAAVSSGPRIRSRRVGGRTSAGAGGAPEPTAEDAGGGCGAGVPIGLSEWRPRVGGLVVSLLGSAVAHHRHDLPEDERDRGQGDADPEHEHAAHHQADAAHDEAQEAHGHGGPGGRGVAVVVGHGAPRGWCRGWADPGADVSDESRGDRGPWDRGTQQRPARAGWPAG